MIKKEIWDFFRPIILKNKFTFILISLNWFIFWIVGVVTPLLLKFETDQLVNQKSYNLFSKEVSPFWIFCIILWLIFFIDILNNIIKSIVQIHIQAKKQYLMNIIWFHLYKRYEDMEIWKLMSSRFLTIKELIQTEIERFTDFLIETPKDIIDLTISIIWITAIYYILDFKLLVIVIISSLIWYLISLWSRNIWKKYEVNWLLSKEKVLFRYSHLVSRDTKNLTIAWGLSTTLKKYYNFLESEIKYTQEKWWWHLGYDIWNLMNENLFSIILKLVVWYWVFRETQSIWMVAFVVASMWKIRYVISEIINFKRRFKEFKFRQECILLYFKLTKKVWNKIFKENINSLEFKNITFSYPSSSKYEKEYIETLKKYIIGKKLTDDYIDREIKKNLEEFEQEKNKKHQEILKNLNFKFEKWNIYWIVWKNWAWKSTLMYLLSGFFRNYEWDILFNNTKTKNILTKDLFNKISFLTQTPFSMWWWTTIYDNLTLWVEKIDEEKMWYYLELFWLDKKIKSLKDWLKTEIWKDIDFSWGETQLIAFIRLLLQDKEIIIMDEWTNQLDADNEVLVMNELLKQKDKKIIIFITHRMSTISRADLIYCLEDWEIKNSWTHKELLTKADNVYASFYKTQILHDKV